MMYNHLISTIKCTKSIQITQATVQAYYYHYLSSSLLFDIIIYYIILFFVYVVVIQHNKINLFNTS